MQQVLSGSISTSEGGATSRLAGRAAAAGGVAFVVLLVVQNALRASEPAADAAPAKVAQYFADERTRAIVAMGIFPLGLLALAAFVAGVWTHSEASPGAGRWWARVGVIGTALLAALFATVNVVDLAIVAQPRGVALTLPFVRILWTLHAAAFTLNFAAIAVALLGLGHAAVAAATTPRWIAWTSTLGAVLLVVPAMLALAVIDGGPWTAFALAGFLLWVVFVVVASAGMWREA